MARPPVCKLMDYGKFKYESALKARESRKNQAQTVIKEIKLRPKIDPHDYGTKKGHVERFLKAGDKVKVTIMFRGREQSRPELGFKLLQRLASDVEELGFVESTPKQDGRNMIMVIGPHKRKTDAMAAAKAERASRSAGRSPIDFDEHLLAEAESADVASEPAESAPAAAPARTVSRPAAAAPASAPPASAPPASAPRTSAPPASAPRTSAPPASATPASPRPAAPRPQPRPASSPAPKPSAPRTAASPAPRPGAPASGTGTPRPTAPRSTAAAARSTASGASGAAAKPGPTRRPADGPVPSPRPVAADKAGDKASQSAAGRPAEGGDSDS